MGKLYTYNAKKVKMALGNHNVTGYADDNFCTISRNSDSITQKVGCDGEVNRSITPDRSCTIKLSLLQDSPTSKWLRNMNQKDVQDGTAIFPILIKDLMGNEMFSCEQAYVKKEPDWGRGKETTNREWEILTADGEFSDIN